MDGNKHVLWCVVQSSTPRPNDAQLLSGIEEGCETLAGKGRRLSLGR